MMEKMRNKKKKKGFTLIELIVVIAILGILAAIAIPRLSGFTDRADKSVLETDVRTIESAAKVALASGDIETLDDVNAVSVLNTDPMDLLEDDFTAYTGIVWTGDRITTIVTPDTTPITWTYADGKWTKK